MKKIPRQLILDIFEHYIELHKVVPSRSISIKVSGDTIKVRMGVWIETFTFSKFENTKLLQCAKRIQQLVTFGRTGYLKVTLSERLLTGIIQYYIDNLELQDQCHWRLERQGPDWFVYCDDKQTYVGDVTKLCPADTELLKRIRLIKKVLKDKIGYYKPKSINEEENV